MKKMLSLMLCLWLAGCGSMLTGEDVFMPPSSYPGLQLTQKGVGGINTNTAYSTKAIKQHLPDARIETVQATADGKVVYVLAAFAPSGMQMLRFEKKNQRVGAIHVVSEDVPGPYGERVGQSYDATGGARMSCQPGTRTWVGMAVCQRRGTPITYVYGLAGRLETTPLRGAELRKAQLTRMIWEP